MGSPRLSQADGSPPWLKHFQGPSVGYSALIFKKKKKKKIPLHNELKSTAL